MTALVRRLRQKFQSTLPRLQLIELAAGILRSTPDRVESTLDWSANYLAGRDGAASEGYHCYPKGQK
ncbi:MAG: hypothetical protein ACI9MR_001756 [Myxococcota bacterium]